MRIFTEALSELRPCYLTVVCERGDLPGSVRLVSRKDGLDFTIEGSYGFEVDKIYHVELSMKVLGVYSDARTSTPKVD